MTPENLVRVGGGLAAIVGGVLGVIASLVALVALLPALLTGQPLSNVYASGIYTLDVLLFLGACILVLGGLIALYASQREAAGVLGVVSFLIAFLGTAFLVGPTWGELFYVPVLAKVAPQSIPEVLFAPRIIVGGVVVQILFLVGWILFGVATLRARIYPRAAAVTLIVGAIIPGLVHLSDGEFIVLAAAIAWLGFLLFRGGTGAVEEPARAR